MLKNQRNMTPNYGESSVLFQTPKTKNLKRSDHIWNRSGKGWKCLLCGGITFNTPPEFPTDQDWTPERYEKLTDKERDMVKP